MPMPISLTLLLGAIAVGLVSPALPVYIMVGLAVLNESLRFVSLRGIQAPVQGEYRIPARPENRVRGDDGG